MAENCECENCECENCECENCDCSLNEELYCECKNASDKECHCDPCDCVSDEGDDEEDEEEVEEEEEDDLDDENKSILRGKWLYDGSKTIDDMIECLEKEIKFLVDLKNDGWFLTEEVVDDYAFIQRKI